MNEQLTDDERRQALEWLEKRRTFGGKILFFQPYPKQRAFLDMGAHVRERLLIAGNQNGKCVSYQTLISHPDGTSTKAGILYKRGKPFPVLSWNGTKLVSTMAVTPIRKPAEPVVRVWLEDGQRFECALNHRVLTHAGEWSFVGPLLESVPSLRPSSSARGPIVHVPSDLHWRQTASDCPDDYSTGSRQHDEQLRGDRDNGRAWFPSPADVLRRICSWWRSGGPAGRHTNIDLAFAGPLSIPDDLILTLAPSGTFAVQAADTDVQSSTSTRRTGSQFVAVVPGGFRLAPATDPDRFARVALKSPTRNEGNRIILWQPIGDQAVYDFTVPHFQNYLCAGVIHHNTITGAYEAALHATGDYPPDWHGKVFTKPTRGWVCGETSVAVRDIQQAKLCGPAGVEAAYGTGMVPKERLIDKSLARGVTDSYDTIQIRHKAGGISTITFKSYEQGRAKFQGESLDWLWFDEEPPQDVYAEGLTRTAATKGIAWMTFTPLKGRSSVVLRFLEEQSPDRGVVMMTIDDAEHISPAEKEKIIAGYLPHEREARARGIPILGSGRIFQTPEEALVEPPLEYIPAHWPKIWGIDFGIDHPFAAVLLIWDRDNDVIHVHHTLRVSGQLPIMHAAAMKPIGAAVPVAWPHDGHQREKTSGESIAELYKRQDLYMLPEHATWPDGGISTEAGIMEMQQRMETGKFKVARQLADWFDEYRFYHRRDNLIVKIKDDLLSATRIALMMKRYARTVQLGGFRERMQASQGIAKGKDFNLFDTGEIW